MGIGRLSAPSLLPRTIQVVLFSATFPEHVHQYASKFAPDANEITLQHEELTVEGIKQLYLDCSDDEDKYRNLVQLYGLLTVGSSIIFVKVCSLTPPTYIVFLTRIRLVRLRKKSRSAWSQKATPLPP